MFLSYRFNFLLECLKNKKISYKSLKYSWKVKTKQVYNICLAQMETFKYKILSDLLQVIPLSHSE